MRGDRTHVVVRFPSMGTTLGPITASEPGSSVDAILESTRIDADGPTYTTVSLLRGLPPHKVEEALAGLAARYEAAPEVLRREPKMTLLRYRMGGRHLAPALRALARFQTDFGAPWSRIEAGTYSMRARVPFGSNATLLAGRMLSALELAGLPAEVEVRGIGGRELEGWYEVEDAVASLRPRVAWLPRMRRQPL